MNYRSELAGEIDLNEGCPRAFIARETSNHTYVHIFSNESCREENLIQKCKLKCSAWIAQFEVMNSYI